ncbi:MAG: putative capsid protein [Cressdnaviricota sp.]|nr:MAG: putative capsid protein [Cressdnaviricota sp.]
MAARKGGSYQGPLTKSGSFRKTKAPKGKKTSMKKLRKTITVDDCQRSLELRSDKTDQPVMVIQVPDMLARSNRRLYEQCRAYDFRLKIGNVGSATEQNYEIYTLSNAWWVKKSIEYAKAVYLNATKDERKMLGSRIAKWNSFTIDTFQGGSTNVNFSNLYQYTPAFAGDTDFEGMTAAEVATDETTQESTSGASEVEGDQDIADDTDYAFSIFAEDLSGSVRSYNIFDQYMLTRQHVTPADSRAGPYQDLLDIDQVAMKNLKESGDNAPFDLDTFPSPWVLADTVTIDHAAGNPASSVSKRITAPLGVVVLKKLGSNNSADSNFAGNEKIILEVMKGKYKGVHAPAYLAHKLILK